MSIKTLSKYHKAILIGVCAFLVFSFSLAAGFLFDKYFKGQEVIDYIKAEIGFKKYVVSQDEDIHFLNNLLSEYPDFKYARIYKENDSYLISIVVKVDQAPEIIQSGIGPDKKELIFDLSVTSSSGQKTKVKVNNFKTHFYLFRRYVDQDLNKFEEVNYYIDERFDKYYFVDDGFKFIKEGDVISLVWTVKTDPRKLIKEKGDIPTELTEFPPEYVFVK